MGPFTLPDVSVLRKLFTYDASTGILTRRRDGTPAGHSVSGYLKVSVAGREYAAHRLAWKLVYGIDPQEAIDHINGVRSDNRIANLRLACRAENNRNSTLRKDNQLRMKGVSPIQNSPGYRARISANGKTHYLGYFETPEAAHEAYCEASRRLHGDFGRTA